MNAELRQLRGIGMTLELLRHRWTYAILVALRHGPRYPAQLLEHVNQGNARNADLVGTRILHEKTLFRTLRRMEKEGLIARGDEATPANGVAAPRKLTPMSQGLLTSLNDIAAWAARHRQHLAITLQQHRGLPRADTAHDGSTPSGRRALDPQQGYWRGIGMTLTMLRRRWSFSIIAQLREGPQHPTGLAAAINAGIERNRDITGSRTLSEKVLWDNLHRLVDGGLIAHEPRSPQFASTAHCDITQPGRDLLASLAPVGIWAARYEKHLTAIIRARRGLITPTGLRVLTET